MHHSLKPDPCRETLQKILTEKRMCKKDREERRENREQRKFLCLLSFYEIDTALHQCRPFPVLALCTKKFCLDGETHRQRKGVHESGTDRFEMPLVCGGTKKCWSLLCVSILRSTPGDPVLVPEEQGSTTNLMVISTYSPAPYIDATLPPSPPNGVSEDNPFMI
jgi:hypothetical protein